MKTSSHRFKLSLFGLVLAGGLLTSSSVRAEEFRAFWVDAWGPGFLNASQVTTLMNHCRTYNFNAVIVQMRRRGDAFYMPNPPNGDPRTTVIASNYDALQEIINQANSGTPRIEVHCWVTTQLIWSNQSTPPSQPGHVYNLHPEYLMKNSSGGTFIGEGYYIDPGHPGATLWNYYMAKDIVSNYNIDGFHWDYIRYPQQNSGYNDTAIARYNQEFGLTGQPASNNAQFSDWRRRQITDFLRWANSDLLEVKPGLVISAAVFASRTDAYTHRLQDWAAWNNEGIIDLCMPMNYTSNNSTYNTRADDAFNNQGVRRVYMGQGAYLNTKENTVTQLLYARNKPFYGIEMYSYRVPNSGTVNQTQTFAYVRDNFQPTWQFPPALPWKASPAKALIKGTVTRQDNGDPIYNADLNINTSPARTLRTDPHGNYAFFEVSPGSYSVTASAVGFAPQGQNVSVSAGQIVNVDFALAVDTTPQDVIIDNPQAGVVGSWTTATAATDKYGADYYFKGQGNGSAYVQYTPNFVAAGFYDVFEWHPQGGNRTEAAPHVINFAGGTDTVYVNQKINGGQWNYLGTYPFNAGTGGNVRITDGFPDAGHVVMADAILFAYAGPLMQTPDAPGDLGATAVNATRIDLTWTDNSDNEDNFIVSRGLISGGPYEDIQTLPADTTSYSDTTVLPGTTYYYVVRAVNEAGSSEFSNQASATTPLPEIIIDNPEATVVGSGWATGTSATGKYGDDYRFKGQGNGSAYLQYTPNIPETGFFEVYTWYPQGSNRTEGAPHLITHNGGADTVYVNQKVNGGQWNLLGAYEFAAGTSGNVRITDGFADGGQVVMADAIKFVGVEAPPPGATMHVADVEVSRVNIGKGQSKARAVVTIVDSSGLPVSGATVTVNFTEAITETKSGMTDGSGVATIQTDGSASNPAHTTGCVSNVTHASLTYNPAANVATCDTTY